MHFIQITLASLLQHWKMMRLLLVCLLLPTATVFSEEFEGSTFEGFDDEDALEENVIEGVLDTDDSEMIIDKSKGPNDKTDQFTLIVIIGTVSVLTVSVTAIVAVMLVRRQMHKQQQGIYSVPTEQDQKGAV
ncbi:uncharacterized protein si:dkey-262k9.2 [Corythoichthys intestinalis]|uniref:uncharacterized protein si:dkey-262k9.2 n=1 Tax=Corythoichthys intestinalis TaxID=161448 RepID=UPI0025A5B8CC|nr:uncharacterized protein si:dkey-262k9.2 [Corythoichthys intestinalis]